MNENRNIMIKQLFIKKKFLFKKKNIKLNHIFFLPLETKKKVIGNIIIEIKVNKKAF